MKTLEDVIIEVEQANDLMYAIEGAMIDATPDEQDVSTRRLHNLTYILMGLLKNIGEDLEEAAGHVKVCNVILASAHVREMEKKLRDLQS